MRRTICAVGFWGLYVAVGGTSVYAQGGQTSPSSHGSFYYLGQALVSLVIVVALIYAIYFGLRRLSSTVVSHKGKDIQVLESQHLGGGRWVYVLAIAGRVLVVGSGGEELRTLAEFSAEEYNRVRSAAGRSGATSDARND